MEDQWSNTKLAAQFSVETFRRQEPDYLSARIICYGHELGNEF